MLKTALNHICFFISHSILKTKPNILKVIIKEKDAFLNYIKNDYAFLQKDIVANYLDFFY